MTTTRPPIFEEAKRENTPLIVGIGGPTKSGKTYSAHRLARSLAEGKRVAMINAEGARGHQYADKFSYLKLDIAPPFRPEVYTAAVRAAGAAQNIGCLIIDSMSHMHDGPGGMLEWHDEIQQRMAARGTKTEAEKEAKLERVTWAAWIEPKAAENEFVYALLELAIPVVLCFRAKEKIKIIPASRGNPSKVENLGWQPIASDRVAFETLFTLMLPPHCKGVPDLSISEMREPFDTMVPAGKPINEELGTELRLWAAGSAGPPKQDAPSTSAPADTAGTVAGGPPAHVAPIVEALKYASETVRRRFNGRLAVGGYKKVDELKAEEVDGALAWIKSAIDRDAAAIADDGIAAAMRGLPKE